jgi:hypothetical protein
MTFRRQWVQRPQDLFLRKVEFQVQLWTGIGVGTYLLAACVSGSVPVYRNELYLSPPVMVLIDHPRLERPEPVCKRDGWDRRLAESGH